MDAELQAPQTRARLAVVVVRFKRAFADISLLNIDVLGRSAAIAEVLIVDNSPDAASDAEVAELPHGVRYRWLGGNVGLSRAYNVAVSELRSDWTHVTFLDQDTAGLDHLLKELEVRISTDLTLPVVRAGDTVLSPCRRIGPWFLPLRSVGSLPKHLSWINSGMTVARDVLGSTRFDERLFLDYVDHQFARSVLANGASVEVRWDIVLDQDYSRDSDSEQQALTRFRLFDRDVRQFYRELPGGPLWSAALTFRRAVGATVQYRSAAFLLHWMSARKVRHG